MAEGSTVHFPGSNDPLSSGPASQHPYYAAVIDQWLACRHAYEGETAMRANADLYVPRVSGDTDDDYKQYVMRAMWYGATARTVSGLTGAVFRTLPTYESSNAIDDDLTDVTLLGDPLATFAQHVFRELLVTGRCPVLVDVTPEGRPYWVKFAAEQLISWEGDHLGGLSRAILQTVDIEHDPEPDKEFEWVQVHRVHVHELVTAAGESGSQVAEGNESGEAMPPMRFYQVRTFRYVASDEGSGKDPWVLEKTVVPQRTGKTLDYIPMVIFGAGGIDPMMVYKPPIVDVVSINISHYRTSADYEHGAHVTSLPTPWVSGVTAGELASGAGGGGAGQDGGGKLRLGAREAWLLPKEQCQAGMLEYTGTGLTTLKDLSDSKKRDMAIMGARLLSEDKAGVETADAMRLRATGESSVLSTIASAFDLGMALCLDYHQRWRNDDDTETVFRTNRDFIDAKLDPKEATALMALWQADAISYETLFRMLQMGEWVDAKLTPEEELERIMSRVKDLTGIEVIPGRATNPKQPPTPPDDDDGDDDDDEPPGGGGDD